MTAHKSCHHIHNPNFNTNCCTSQDLLNFDDPLNVEAAEHYERDKVSSTYRMLTSRTQLCPTANIFLLFNYSYFN